MAQKTLQTKFHHRTWYTEKNSWTFQDFFDTVIHEATSDGSDAGDWRINNYGLIVELNLFERGRKRGQMRLNDEFAKYLINGLLNTGKTTAPFQKYAKTLLKQIETGNTDERLF